MVMVKDRKPVTKTPDKPKAARYPVGTLVVIAAYRKTFASGKSGWFGQAQDPNTGQKFQIIGAVEIGPK